MLNIYAHTIMIAARYPNVRVHDMRSAAPAEKRLKWRGPRKTRVIDVSKL